MSEVPQAVRWALNHDRMIPDEALRREVAAVLEVADHQAQYGWYPGGGAGKVRPLYSHREHAVTIWRLLDRIAELEEMVTAPKEATNV